MNLTDKITGNVLLWTKVNSQILRIVGGILFLVAIVAGVIWALGYDVEPVAFTLGMLSSLFMASPSIAEYFLPDRKPVRHMTFEELISFVPTTDPRNDWHGITKNWSSEYFLKEDPRLRYRAKLIDDGVQNENFVEEWANRHPDSKATGYWYDLIYDGAFIDRNILVSVDGGRASIPPPRAGTSVISRTDYHFAMVHDTLGTLDEYIGRSGLEVAAPRSPLDTEPK